MTKRSEILEKHIEVAASKAREHEERDIAQILSERARNGVLTTGGLSTFGTIAVGEH
jgi:hypothetical protein